METVAEGGSEHSMYVDDEQGLAILGQEFLEDMGYTVTPMFSSTEALEAFKADPQRYDLVVTDQTMPEMTGKEFARRVLQSRPDMPIVLCTGYSADMDLDVSLKMGIKAFIMKPVSKASTRS